MKVIIYLTDVNSEEDGPFRYVPDTARLLAKDPFGSDKTHALLAKMKTIRGLGCEWADFESRKKFMENVPDRHRFKSAVGLDHDMNSSFFKEVEAREVAVLGKRGTAVFFDPMGLHHGGECEGESKRVMLQLMFSADEGAKGGPSKPMPEAKAGGPVEIKLENGVVLGVTAKTHFWEVDETVLEVGGSPSDAATVKSALVRHRRDSCRPWEAYEKERPGHKGYDFEYEMSHSSLFCNYAYALDDVWTGRGEGPIKLLEIGVFEARTASWLIEYLLVHPESEYVGVDPRVAEFAKKNQQVREKTGSFCLQIPLPASPLVR